MLEKGVQAGGRVRSTFARDAKQIIDNGQHALAASYHFTLDMLKTIGSDHLLETQAGLSVNYLIPGKQSFHFRSWRLPAPLHFALPLLIQGPLSNADRRQLIRWGLNFRKADPEQLRSLTVADWLEASGTTSNLTDLLWEPITLATLNTSTATASAYLLHRVLVQAFLASRAAGSLVLPGASLDEIFARPACRYIERNGGAVHTRQGAAKLNIQDGRVHSVTTANGENIAGQSFISALPPKALWRLLKSSDTDLAKGFTYLDQFDYSPIITIYFWLDKPLKLQFPAALVNSPIQWIFKLPKAMENTLHGYSIVISAADKEAQMDVSELLGLAVSEIEKYTGIHLRNDLGMDAAKVIKEKSATIDQTPASLARRPGYRTNVRNFFLAGDWVDTGLPATIESAVQSGVEVVELIGDG